MEEEYETKINSYFISSNYRSIYALGLTNFKNNKILMPIAESDIDLAKDTLNKKEEVKSNKNLSKDLKMVLIIMVRLSKSNIIL